MLTSPPLEPPICAAYIGCGLCRKDTDKGRAFRDKYASKHFPALSGDWACPFGRGDVGTVPVKPPRRMEGAGDAVAWLAGKLGIEPCAGCVERHAALNAAMPFQPLKPRPIP